VNAILSPGSTYYVDTRTYDTQGNNSTVTTASVTTTAERAPGAPEFSLAVAAGDAGKYKFNITSTGGAAGSYLLTTQYRVETSTGTQLTDWTTISSNSSTVTAYGADTSSGAGALDPATTYSVRLRSVAATSGTITYAAYQTVTTVSIGPNAPSMVVTPVAGTAGEFSFTISLTPGTAESHPIDGSQYRIRTGASTYLSGYSSYQGITSPITIGTSTYVSAILAPGSTYYVDARTYDTQGNYSTVTTASVTTTVERAPVAPTFSPASASGDAGTFKFNITWTAGAAGSYPRTTQYRVETSTGTQLTDWTTISSSPTTYGADTYNVAGALSPSTTYKVRLKSVAATSGTETLAAYQTVTTNAIVAPNAPTSLSADPVAETAGEFSFTFSHTQGNARSYPIDGSQYRIRTNNVEPYTYVTNYSSYQQFTGTITIGTSTYVNAILSPGSTYYVDARTYDTQGTFSDVTTDPVTLTAKRNPTVGTGTVTVTAPSYNGTNTTTLNVSKTDFTAGSWPISYYQYSTNTGTTWKTLSGSSISVLSSSSAALVADTEYTVYVRAVDTQGNVSGSVSGTATTNAALPPTPTIAWRDMTGASYGTAQFTISGNAGSTTTVKIFRRTTSGSNTGADEFTKATGSQDITGHASNGATSYYVAYNYNKHGSQSAASNEIYWTRPAKNTDWSVADETSAIYFSSTESFTSEFRYVFGGGIPDDNDAPGYYDVRSLAVAGIQQTGTNLNGCSGVTSTLANTSYLFWQTTSAHPDFGYGLNNGGLSAHWTTGNFTTRSVTLTTYGGSALNNTVWNVHTTVGYRTASGAVGCTAGSTGLNGYRMKNFVISGKRTTNGSGTGF
jgi:hypothetical protein